MLSKITKNRFETVDLGDAKLFFRSGNTPDEARNQHFVSGNTRDIPNVRGGLCTPDKDAG